MPIVIADVRVLGSWKGVSCACALTAAIVRQYCPFDREEGLIMVVVVAVMVVVDLRLFSQYDFVLRTELLTLVLCTGTCTLDWQPDAMFRIQYVALGPVRGL